MAPALRAAGVRRLDALVISHPDIDHAGGLRKLVDGGCSPDAMMVISPETTPYVYRSVGFLWEQGVETVRANRRNLGDLFAE